MNLDIKVHPSILLYSTTTEHGYTAINVSRCICDICQVHVLAARVEGYEYDTNTRDQLQCIV